MNFLALIEAKRDGQRLSPATFQQAVSAYISGKIPDYQMAAFLMAVYFRGLDRSETAALTLAMRDSGEVLSFPAGSPVVDKHSTGGVGDKVSLPLAPLLACLGFRVPMISGRGLGITGGTLDKLDSIPGFQSLLPAGRLRRIVGSVGCVICGQTESMVPADKGLYALRDVTGTVPSIPLIVASILSKKLAEGLDALILDVKYGAAAFMPDRKRARELARAMVTLGNQCGVKTRAILTDMNTPLGHAAGNWLEVKESAECLQPGAPADTDLMRIVTTCAAQLLQLAGKAKDARAAAAIVQRCLDSGEPLRRWEAMLAAQGADLRAYRARLALDHTARVVRELRATRAGYVVRCDARVIGETIRDLGGGRLTREARIDYSVGVDRMAKPGQAVGAGGLLVRVHAASDGDAAAAVKRLAPAFVISARRPRLAPLIAETIS
jgi:pyrimidine-nucleoside phosphorylase